MANPNPRTDQIEATQFKPGQSGNPGGKSAAQRKAEVDAAENAAILRAKMLEAIAKDVGEGGDILQYLKPEALKLFKDSEDRAHGTPTQQVDHLSSDGSMTPKPSTVEFVSPQLDEGND